MLNAQQVSVIKFMIFFIALVLQKLREIFKHSTLEKAVVRMIMYRQNLKTEVAVITLISQHQQMVQDQECKCIFGIHPILIDSITMHQVQPLVDMFRP